MGYSAEVVRRASQRLAEAKNEKAMQTRAKLQEVYRELPRVRQIDSLLIKTMALAAKAALSPEGEAAMAAARQENLVLQAERTQLITQRFGAGYLDETPVCDRCSGAGYLGSTMCHCLEALCAQEQKKELSLLSCGQSSFRDFRMDYYPDVVDPNTGYNPRQIMEKTFEYCVQYARNFNTQAPNLLFSGNTGLGKTFLSACIAGAVTEAGFSVAYESAPHLFSKLEKARFTDDPELRRQAEQETRKYTQCDLMIIDDLGTEMGGQFVTAALYALVNDRLLLGKPTIISTNLANEELEKRYSMQTLSRLRGQYKRIPFIGEDIRVLKNRGF